MISGIVHVLKSEGRWTDTPRDLYGPKKTLYNRFVRWAAKGFWVGLSEPLAHAGGQRSPVLIDSTAVKAVSPCWQASCGYDPGPGYGAVAKACICSMSRPTISSHIVVADTRRSWTREKKRAILANTTLISGALPHSFKSAAELLAISYTESRAEVVHRTGRAAGYPVPNSLRVGQGVWGAHRRLRTSKRLRDPAFAVKVEDVVGPNMTPSSYAVFLSIVGKRLIQSLERARHDRPLSLGHPSLRQSNLEILDIKACGLTIKNTYYELFS